MKLEGQDTGHGATSPKHAFGDAVRQYELYFPLVPGTGLEPASLAAADFKSAVYTSFTTPAAAAVFYAQVQDLVAPDAGRPSLLSS